jgi:photosystem II stability/assembly factor-like uncharacterized protein
MKKLVTIIIYLIFGTMANAQWSTATIPSSQSYLYSITFVSGGSTGYAVGNAGSVLKTTDGGATWLAQTSLGSNDLKCVFFANSSNGWIVGVGGAIYYTTNGGNNWTAQTSGTTSNLRGVYFVSATQGWVVGDAGTILTTTDGDVSNATWTAQTSITPANTNILRDVFFTDASTGWAVGDAGTILNTTDGGNSWTSQTVGASYNFRGVWFTGANTGWAVSTGPAIYYTSNGTAWNAVSNISPISTSLYSVSFIDANNGIVVGNRGGIYKTTNGSSGTGSTWSSQIIETIGYQLYDVAVANASTAAAVGYDATSTGVGLVEYTTNAALPVGLSSFSASVVNNSVNLTWKTTTEVNNYGFDVERSLANSAWQKIGFVAGSGNSNSPKEYSFTDNPSGGTSFSYRLKQIDIDGSFKYYDAVTVNLTASSQPQLLQNSPNPFNPSTTIKFYIPNISDVTIKIYDILGREVNTLINQQTTAGYHNVYWNGKNNRGEDVSSGVYLYRLTAGSFSETKKMNLLK